MNYASSHAEDGRCDQGDHRSAESSYHPFDGGDLAVLDVDGAHDAEEDEGREDEESPGCDRSPNPVHRVADVGRELLCLRAVERHAEVESVKEAALRDPAPPLDKLVVHDRDLARRPAEADHPELQPEPKRLPLCR